MEKRNTIATLSVGSIVRVPRFLDDQRKDYNFSGKAVISYIDTDKGDCSVIFEPINPPTISPIVAPSFPNVNIQDGVVSSSEDNYGEEEIDYVPLSSIQSILDFESQEGIDDQNLTASRLKERGDILFRLRDFSSAIIQYEEALSLTSNIDIGGTIIIQKEGRLVLAEIDCIDVGDDNTDHFILDVTCGEDEITMPKSDALLGLLENDETERLQERILLNLTRCCLQMANIDTAYRKSAVLGSSLALTCHNYNEGRLKASSSAIEKVNSTPSMLTEEKARLLRARAFLSLGKFKHVSMDLNHILRQNPSQKDAKKLLIESELVQKKGKQVNRKLAKEMCKWINDATQNDQNDSISIGEKEDDVKNVSK